MHNFGQLCIERQGYRIPGLCWRDSMLSYDRAFYVFLIEASAVLACKKCICGLFHARDTRVLRTEEHSFCILAWSIYIPNDRPHSATRRVCTHGKIMLGGNVGIIPRKCLPKTVNNYPSLRNNSLPPERIIHAALIKRLTFNNLDDKKSICKPYRNTKKHHTDTDKPCR